MIDFINIENLISSFTSVLLLALILFPLFIVMKLNKLKFRRSFIFYLILGLIGAFLFIFLIAWWVDFSNKFLLVHYGFDFQAMNDFERYENVKKVDFIEVKELEKQMMGICWPLKAILFYVVFYLPYFIIVFVLNFLAKKLKVFLFSLKFYKNGPK